ncbi:MAG: hypothetical protein RI953_655 [Pseudomonadota bacterium]|jgi:hypothetical protein
MVSTMSFRSVVLLSLPLGFSISCVKRDYNSAQTMSSSGAAVFIRGDFNNWQPQKMIYSNQFLARDFITFPACASGTVEFKFDLKGDWSTNFGDNDNVRGFIPNANWWEGQLDLNGGNIKIPCGKTYLIGMFYYGGDNMRYYRYREIDGKLKQDVDAGTSVTFRKAIHGGGFYGAESYSGEILVRNPDKISKLGVAFKSERDPQGFGGAWYRETLANGVQVWEFAAGTYGTMKLEKITYVEDGKERSASIDPKFVDN